MPGSLESGRITLQGELYGNPCIITLTFRAVHDFFQPQPVANADVFLLYTVLHDWSDKYAAKILRYLRNAAMPSTQLLIVDNLMSYACADDSNQGIFGVEIQLPPSPLLANYGYAGAISYYEDMAMLAIHNGKERTITELASLLDITGWKMIQVVQGGHMSSHKVIAIPV